MSFEWGCWAKSHGPKPRSKSHGTHNAPIFMAGEFDLPRLEKYSVFVLFVVENGGSLMLACSNVHVIGEFFILFLVLHLVRLFEFPNGL